MGEANCGGNWVLFWWAGPCSVNLQFNFLSMGKAVFLPCCLTWDQTMVEVMKIMAASFKMAHACTATLSAPDPAAGHCQLMPPPETPGHSQIPQPLTGGSHFPLPCSHAPATAPCWIKSLDGAAWSSSPARQVELFQILKDDAVKVLHSIC